MTPVLLAGKSSWTHTAVGALMEVEPFPVRITLKSIGQQPMLPVGSPSHSSTPNWPDELWCSSHTPLVSPSLCQCSSRLTGLPIDRPKNSCRSSRTTSTFDLASSSRSSILPVQSTARRQRTAIFRTKASPGNNPRRSSIKLDGTAVLA